MVVSNQVSGEDASMTDGPVGCTLGAEGLRNLPSLKWTQKGEKRSACTSGDSAWLDVEFTWQKQNAKTTPRQRWIRRQLHREFPTLNLKCLLSKHEQPLGKLRVWKTEEKRKREQRKFVEVNNLWAAQRKFLFDHSHLPQAVPEKALLEQLWAGILEVSGQVDERDPDVKGWKEEV